VGTECFLLGNSVKPYHPQNVGLSKFMKQVRETAIGKRARFMKRGEMNSPNEFRMFHKFLNKHQNNGRTRPFYSNFQSVSGSMILAEVWNQEIAKV
jgi:hypothetical protein